jgi:type I restriction enzyme S subunit
MTIQANAIHAWVGKPPANWRADCLKWSVSLSVERPTDAETESLPYIANEDIESWTGKLLRPDPQPIDADSRKFHNNDVLFNKLRPYLAKVYHATFDGVSSGELLCLRPSLDVFPRYLFYVVSSKAFVDAVNAETFGSKMPRADWNIVGHQPFPHPRLDTQKRIAAFLDENTAQIDGLVSRKQALLQRLAERRHATITRAVTKGLNPGAPTKDSGIDWVGQIPSHWQILPLRRIATSVATGRTPPSAAGDFFSDGVVPWFTPGDFGDDLVLGDAEKKLSLDAFDEGFAAKYPANTVLLVGIGATLGKVGLTPTACSSNQQINAITVSDEDDPYYLATYLQAFRAEVRMQASGNTLPILNQDKTKAIHIVRPPLNEQREISKLIAMIDERLSLTKARIQESIERLNELRSALINAAVTGQIEGLR